MISNPMENYRAKLGRDALCYVPKCYGTGVVDGLSGPAIILEDFGTDARGLKPIPLTEYHTQEQVRRCLAAMGEFHAVGQAMMREGGLAEAREPLLADILGRGDLLEMAYCRPSCHVFHLLKDAATKLGDYINISYSRTAPPTGGLSG